MQCSAEEIEWKRQQALQKLASKNKSPLKIQNDQQFKNSNSHGKSEKFSWSKSSSTLQSKSNGKPFGSTANKSSNSFSSKEQVVTIKCALQSHTRFVVETEFSTPVIEIFKTIPSKSYDAKTRCWSFSLKDYEDLMSKLNSLGNYVEIMKLPKFVLKCLKVPERNLSSIDLSPIDPELLNSLMPFQKEGVAYGIDKNGRYLIADDMGLGKTFQALGVASYYRNDWPMLIVTTASMKNSWEETILQYLPSVPIMKLQYMVSTKDYINDCCVLIVSHDMLLRALDKLLERKFGVVIFDESHTFKNFKAKGTQAAMKISQVAKRVILLSGTPALSRPSELFTQLSFINKSFFGNFIEYSKRYCDGKTTNFGWDASGQSNLQELEIILAKKFMIRRTKEQVLSAMPNKSQEIITLDVKLEQMSEDDRTCLNSLAKKYNMKKGTEKHSILLTFFSETARIKIPSVLSYILQILDSQRKFLLFAHHQIMLNAIEQILKKKHKKFIRIDGSTNTSQRNNLVNEFQTNDECVCAILSITAANAGITLTAANLVIFAELHWNPSILSQAESRAHRIGQDKPVYVRYLLAPGTADDSIWPMLQKKQKILIEAGLSKDNFDNVDMKSQANRADVKLTEGISYTTTQNTLDISTYFESPSKKQKLNDSVVSDLNDSFFDNSMNTSKLLENIDEITLESNKNSMDISESTSQSAANFKELFNDGFDDILSNIDI